MAVAPETLANQALELTAVAGRPRHAEQALRQDTGIRDALVLNNHGRAALVQPERVDAPAVHGTGAVLGGQEANPEHDLRRTLDKGLHLGLSLFFVFGGLRLGRADP